MAMNAIKEFYKIVKTYIEKLPKEDAVIYSTKGKAFTKEEYAKHIHSISNSMANGANKNTTKEVKNFILNS